jgi:osmotically inducible protein OsmC
MPVRKAEAVWEGDLPNGSGTMKMASGAYEGPYSFSSRFQEGSGTNPEELLAAAHAGCFSMAFSKGLTDAGHIPNRVHTTARVHLEKGESGFSVTRIELTTEASVPGMEEGVFQKTAESAKNNCPVSRLFKGAEISVNAKLANE